MNGTPDTGAAPADTFRHLRPRLSDIAYRMLGSTAEAEEVVQDAWLRYIDGVLESAQAYESDGERILRIHVQRNPDKLALLLAAVTQQGAGPS